MKRRNFNALLGSAAGLGLAANSGIQPEAIPLARNGWMPNNAHLPVLLYRKAISVTTSDPAALFEETFRRHGWPPQWRDGVYDFHHYHSTAHEVLGFAGGRAKLILGGENGHTIDVTAGDVIVLPTGTGHCRLWANSDFLVIGAYPEGQQWDVCRNAPTAEMVTRMRDLQFPTSDPVSGKTGPLNSLWRLATS